jgi:hypothetical protein
VDRFTAPRFTASSAVPAWEFVYDLSAVGGRLLSVTISEQCVPSWCDIL